MLRIGITLLCRLTNPLNRFIIILWCSSYEKTGHSEIKLSVSIALLCQSLELALFETLSNRAMIPFVRFCFVLWHAETIRITRAEIVLSISISLVSSLAKPLGCFGIIFGYAESCEVSITEQHLFGCIPFFRQRLGFQRKFVGGGSSSGICYGGNFLHRKAGG